MSLSYKIDSTTVTLKRAGYQPLGRHAQPVIAGAPGQATQFAVTSPPRGVDLVVTGTIEATGATVAIARENLHTTLRGYMDDMGDTATHDITLDGLVYEDCVLLDCRPTSSVRAVGAATPTVGVDVAWRWRQLTNNTSAAS